MVTEYLDHIAIARQLLEQQGEINTLTERTEKAEAAIARVRQVHHTTLDLDGRQMCAAECEAVPCATIRALAPAVAGPSTGSEEQP